ncbi:uncharacterized protein E0L32_003012 [Thyridium curvatum]|uniref:NACHT domain-containing protein n=1 Tax=Thyridium curvatum TaxID=1093900 RepID=A0A507BL63_9PEZI|nr:uncharacterized protein E0L32_003012 [Thyridium curvatum]TPX17911.1 hypothetical protein E0L32_003012 [Thyridium curvatum]
MEALAALSVACNVMQVISFGYDAIEITNKLRVDRSPDPDLGSATRQLKAIGEELERAVHAAPAACTGPAVVGPSTSNTSTPYPATSSPHLSSGDELRKVAHEVVRISDSLAQELESQEVKDTHVDVTRLDQKTQAFVDKLQQGQINLSQLILKDGKTTQDLVASESKRIIGEMQQEHRNISQHMFENGRDTRNLVTAEGSETRRHLAVQLESLHAHVSDGIQDTNSYHIEAEKGKQVDRLLNSLRYENMNQRLNNITTRHEKTFEWLFVDRPTSQEMDDDIGGDSLEDIHESDAELRDHSIGDTSSECTDDGTDDYVPGWDEFSKWLCSEDRLYWISGKPGSGKSTLMKFLAQDDRTTTYLRQWRSDPSVLSVFIFKAGTPMQSSLSGVLLSLFHQCLLTCPETSARLLQENPALMRKSSYHDWSVGELELLLGSVIAKSDRSFCIFIDGLDEIKRKSPDEAPGLLRTIDILRTLSNVKFCVSSRPEAFFERRLQGHPLLRLQDLNEEDIRHYVESALEDLSHQFDWLATKQNYTESSSKKDDFSADELSEATSVEDELHYSTKTRIINLIVFKAQGVFLWVALVVRSVISGLNNRDDWGNLYGRIRELDDDLAMLYNSMWKRLNEDTKVYREQAAFYLQVVLESQQHPQSELWRGAPLTLFSMVAMVSEKPFRDMIWRRWGPMTSDFSAFISQKCETTKRQVLARSAGLLEINPVGGNPWEQSVDFIHRSAYDFLNDTDEGQAILEFGRRSTDDLNILGVESELCRISYFSHDPDRQKWLRGPLFEVGQFYTFYLSDDARKTCLAVVKYWMGLALTSNDAHREVTEAAADGRFWEVVEHSLALLPPPAPFMLCDWTTRLLHYAVIRRAWDRMPWLLKEGADPNWRHEILGTCFSPFPAHLFGFGRAADLFLGNFYDLDATLGVLRAFLDHGLDPETRTLAFVTSDVHKSELFPFSTLTNCYEPTSWTLSRWHSPGTMGLILELSYAQLAMLTLSNARGIFNTRFTWNKLWAQCPEIFPSATTAPLKMTHLVIRRSIPSDSYESVANSLDFCALSSHSARPEFVLAGFCLDSDLNETLRPEQFFQEPESHGKEIFTVEGDINPREVNQQMCGVLRRNYPDDQSKERSRVSVTNQKDMSPDLPRAAIDCDEPRRELKEHA